MVSLRMALAGFFIFTSSLNGIAQGLKVDKSVLLQSDQHQSENNIVPKELTVRIIPEELSKEPISPILGGFLFEMGYGDMEGPLWAEMFFNRKFEKFPPYYFDRNWWYQLQDHGKPYLEKDWTRKSWYHNGYEHNAWFAAPGSEGPFLVDTATTFFNKTTPIADVSIEPMRDPGSANQFVRIVNRDKMQSAGLAQQGKWMRKNMKYHFRGSFRTTEGNVKAEILIFSEGKWDKPLLRLPVSTVLSTTICNRLSK